MNMSPTTPLQWTELGERLGGSDSEQTRAEILQNLLDLEKRVFERRNTDVPHDRLRALSEAVQVAKSLCGSVLKPVDLSNL
jgi:hypothetical protein